METPEGERSGWAFNPLALEGRWGRKPDPTYRPSDEWVSRVLSKIGERAGVIVEPAKGSGKPKYASAHDLRRACAERLLDAGVPERDVARVMRHASIETTRRHYAPGNVQKSAAVLRERLGTEVYPVFQGTLGQADGTGKQAREPFEFMK